LEVAEIGLARTSEAEGSRLMRPINSGRVLLKFTNTLRGFLEARVGHRAFPCPDPQDRTL
jgi:hypothetical protein